MKERGVLKNDSGAGNNALPYFLTLYSPLLKTELWLGGGQMREVTNYKGPLDILSL